MGRTEPKDRIGIEPPLVVQRTGVGDDGSDDAVDGVDSLPLGEIKLMFGGNEISNARHTEFIRMKSGGKKGT